MGGVSPPPGPEGPGRRDVTRGLDGRSLSSARTRGAGEEGRYKGTGWEESLLSARTRGAGEEGRYKGAGWEESLLSARTRGAGEEGRYKGAGWEESLLSARTRGTGEEGRYKGAGGEESLLSARTRGAGEEGRYKRAGWEESLLRQDQRGRGGGTLQGSWRGGVSPLPGPEGPGRRDVTRELEGRSLSFARTRGAGEEGRYKGAGWEEYLICQDQRGRGGGTLQGGWMGGVSPPPGPEGPRKRDVARGLEGRSLSSARTRGAGEEGRYKGAGWEECLFRQDQRGREGGTLQGGWMGGVSPLPGPEGPGRRDVTRGLEGRSLSSARTRGAGEEGRYKGAVGEESLLSGPEGPGKRNVTRGLEGKSLSSARTRGAGEEGRYKGAGWEEYLFRQDQRGREGGTLQGGWMGGVFPLPGPEGPGRRDVTRGLDGRSLSSARTRGAGEEGRYKGAGGEESLLCQDQRGRGGGTLQGGWMGGVSLPPGPEGPGRRDVTRGLDGRSISSARTRGAGEEGRYKGAGGEESLLCQDQRGRGGGTLQGGWMGGVSPLPGPEGPGRRDVTKELGGGGRSLSFARTRGAGEEGRYKGAGGEESLLSARTRGAGEEGRYKGAGWEESLLRQDQRGRGGGTLQGSWRGGVSPLPGPEGPGRRDVTRGLDGRSLSSARTRGAGEEGRYKGAGGEESLFRQDQRGRGGGTADAADPLQSGQTASG